MPDHEAHRPALRRIARRAMLDRGLAPDFTRAAIDQLDDLKAPASPGALRDLRALPWCSIDNDDSRDLDQLTVSEQLPGGAVRLTCAIADVDALVEKNTPLDAHAAHNTTSVYTAAQIFPMLPEKLSTGLTSLNENEDRAAILLSFVVSAEGEVSRGEVSQAYVHNHAKLAYDSVAAWIEGKGPLPQAAAQAKGMEEQLRVQDTAAQLLRKRRIESGALQLQSIEARPVFEGDRVVSLTAQEQNRARQLIEELMVAANGVAAEFLAAKKFPSLRRIVRSPERWQKIVNVAQEYGESLPAEPDSRALEVFLARRRAADPLRFPDLSLVIVKLMGRGEYMAEGPGQESLGHFGLAVRDYSHTTAPNRRFPDLVTHRQIKAALAGQRAAYPLAELTAVATRCSDMEAAASKVERQVRKSAAALVLQDRVGQSFDGVITGASPKGTYVRVFNPPVEGRVVRGDMGLKVGDRVQVKLVSTDFERGFIDFARK